MSSLWPRRIWIHRYQLMPIKKIGANAVAGQSPRHGFLIRTENQNHEIGYADVFAWPELGDLDCSEQLKSLQKQKPTSLVRRALDLAEKDAKLRSQKKSAFVSGLEFENYFLCPDLLSLEPLDLEKIFELGFQKIKIKLGQNFELEIKKLNQLATQLSRFRLRFDFNSKGSLAKLQLLNHELSSSVVDLIDYIEDPMPYDLQGWSESSRLFTLANDHNTQEVNWEQDQPLPFSVLIAKPARQSLTALQKISAQHDLSFVVTSSLDHPVGMGHAFWGAQKLKSQIKAERFLTAGCLTLWSYEPNPFYDLIRFKGSQFKSIPGTGIGFDELLEEFEWVQI